MSSIEVMICAALSVLSRAGLNVIDRKSYGHLQLPMLLTNTINNSLPLLGLTVALPFYADRTLLLGLLLDWRLIVFAGIIQLVAYCFSYAFRYLDIPSVLIFSKCPDMFIPLTVFLVLGYWSNADALFSLVSVLVLLPIMWQQKFLGCSHIALLMLLLLVIQATVAPILVPMHHLNSHVLLNTLFVVIFYRFVFCYVCLFYAHRSFTTLRGQQTQWGLLLVRGVLAISTQFFFIAAISADSPVVAWPILNSTALIGIFFSALFLSEPANKAQLLTVVGLFACALVRVLY